MQDAKNYTRQPDTKAPARTTNISRRRRRWLSGALTGLAIALVLASIVGTYVYAASPSVIRSPKLEHYHFRMQVLVNGKAENFGSRGYQVGYAKDQCNANLPEQPIHFHDKRDQFVHIHWEGMTGGMVMKYYGWNFIGGLPGALGYKLDKLTDPQKVTTHGNYLPAIPDGSNFYVYTGDEKAYKQRSFDDWRDQDLEQFFGSTSNFPAHQINKKTSLLDAIFPKAAAHSSSESADSTHAEAEAAAGASTSDDEAERLTQINNLQGSVVIFVQDNKPTDAQVKERFKKLLPLTDSTCGG